MRIRVCGAVVAALVLALPPSHAGADEPTEPVATRLLAAPAPKVLTLSGRATVVSLGGALGCYPYPGVYWWYAYAQCVYQGLVHEPPQPAVSHDASAQRTYVLSAVLQQAPSGEPVSGAPVRFRVSSGQVFEARTDGDGQARVVGTDWTHEEEEYTASFAGTATHLASTDTAPVTGPHVCTRVQYRPELCTGAAPLP